ncbi:hypothetical protein GCM10020258_48190 [Sphingomonas yabuuchiae]
MPLAASGVAWASSPSIITGCAAAGGEPGLALGPYAERASRHGGPFRPDPGRPDLPSGLAWAYHFDASLYAALLRRHAEAAGVVRVEGRIASVARETGGRVDHVVLDGGQAHAGDLFIDCTGFRALLIGETLAEPFDDWSELLPCDRALAVAGERTSPCPLYPRDRTWRRLALAHSASVPHRQWPGL